MKISSQLENNFDYCSAEFGVFFYENYFAPRHGAESRESLKTQKIGAVRFVEFAPRLW